MQSADSAAVSLCILDFIRIPPVCILSGISSQVNHTTVSAAMSSNLRQSAPNQQKSTTIRHLRYCSIYSPYSQIYFLRFTIYSQQICIFFRFMRYNTDEVGATLFLIPQIPLFELFSFSCLRLCEASSHSFFAFWGIFLKMQLTKALFSDIIVLVYPSF